MSLIEKDIPFRVENAPEGEYVWICIECDPPCERRVKHTGGYLGIEPKFCVCDGKPCEWILGIYPDGAGEY